MEAVDRIKQILEFHRVVLFMRGRPDRPMCEGSAMAAEALISTGETFHVIDVQNDPEIRAYLPKYSDQKGFPQFFLQGELIGGAEIVRELSEQGELGPMVRRCQSVTALAS